MGADGIGGFAELHGKLGSLVPVIGIGRGLIKGELGDE
jgi:hypothetical protein